MQVEATENLDVKILTPNRSGDLRGFFSEVSHRRVFALAGVTLDFVQDNLSLSRDVGAVRTELPLAFGDPRLQRRIFLRQRQKLFPLRRDRGIRHPFHF